MEMKNKSISVSFADLTYTKQGIASHLFPLGISFVAAYAKKKSDINANIFKYPDDFEAYLERTTPIVACFSSYAWNNNLAYGFAKRIKNKHPKTIIVFGGPNYPLQSEEQKLYLSSYPAIDFYVRGEGEKAFVELIDILFANEFNVEKVKAKDIPIPNTHYLRKDKLVESEVLPRIESLDEIPSPYLEGLHDKFFDGMLTPMIQTLRGCPFTCTYCQDGNKYFNKTARLSPERIKQDLEYIAERVDVPNLLLADDNFGMYEEDVTTAKTIAELRNRFEWPMFIDVATGKNHSERVIECVAIIGGKINLSASVQSTDPVVLKNIKRNNISCEDMIKLAKSSDRLGASGTGEVILGLPGDSMKAHIKSNTDLIDLDINQIRNYQLILLPGSEIASKENRKKYGMKTQFRVLPLCFGNYRAYGGKFTAAELDEICVSNNTLSFEDYLKCREFDLTIEIAYNSGIFRELINFLRINNVKPSTFVTRMSEVIPKNMREVYENFRKETESSIWQDKKELERFLKMPGNLAKGDSSQEFRTNEIYAARAFVFFQKMKDLHDVVFGEAKNLIDKSGKSDEYLNELFDFSLARKDELLKNKTEIRIFHFDFVKLERNNFNNNPFEQIKPEGIKIEIAHTPEQKEMISKYVKQFGNTIDGLGRILHKNFVNSLYRSVKLIS